MSELLNNPLLMTDVYKLGHMRQYPEDTEYVYSYLEARKDGTITWFGLQYLLKQYLCQPITHAKIEEFIDHHEDILGPVPPDVMKKLLQLHKLGYIPLKIKALPEGSVVNNGTALLTVTNTVPGFHWCVGFFESLLLKLWYMSSVASYNRKYYVLSREYADRTCDNDDHLSFQVHDFGYRSGSSEETSAAGGAACLLYFNGSDTVLANKFIKTYYAPKDPSTVIMKSVPASEHSVMCSYGKENEIEAFHHMLRLYPTGIVSIVSDTYDLWNVLTNYTHELYSVIMERDGKVVFRPDSGDPVAIICGDPNAPEDSPAGKGALELLWEVFGGTTNSKGYRVLNPKVGLIYGDGMHLDRYTKMLQCMEVKGFASSNLVIGVGGIMIQNHSRDDHGFALKATHIQRGHQSMPIFKDPITDPGKKSKTGLLRVDYSYRRYTTHQLCSINEELGGELRPVFMDGKLLIDKSIEEVRLRAKAGA